jgi:ribose transport system substrate-binding protein
MKDALRKTAAVTAGALFIAAAATGLARGAEYNDGQSVKYYDNFKGKKVIAIVISSGLDVAQGFTAGLIGQARDLGYELSIRDYNWNNDQGAQAISQAISEKPDVLVIQNLDMQAYSSLLKRGMKEGVKTVQVVVKSTASTDGYVGPDWYQMASKNAEKLVKACSPSAGKSGKVAILQGTPNNPTNFVGMKAAEDVFGAHPEIKIVSKAAADWDATKAHSVAETVLKQNPDLCGYLGFWDGQDVGMAAAIKESGKKGQVFVTSTGTAQQAACDLVKDGSFDNYVSFDIKQIARQLGSAVSVVMQQNLPPGSSPFAVYVASPELTPATIKPDDCWNVDEIKSAAWK